MPFFLFVWLLAENLEMLLHRCGSEVSAAFGECNTELGLLNMGSILMSLLLLHLSFFTCFICIKKFSVASVVNNRVEEVDRGQARVELSPRHFKKQLKQKLN
ncbi:hypothetical protein ATANTOWER_015412 [Ataeniobius toweri]|uniref:Uncharacterized protein n=1 Tax=Ataeniobius toweri TaxID=208326 RepID=A0ABU7AY31_9TELE|nr:hypothetical protein [Ataeniobius toweri]